MPTSSPRNLENWQALISVKAKDPKLTPPRICRYKHVLNHREAEETARVNTLKLLVIRHRPPCFCEPVRERLNSEVLACSRFADLFEQGKVL
jgi:hypothetical protein